MGRYICSEREKKNGLIIGSALIIAGSTLTAVSSVLLAKSNNESGLIPGEDVPSNPYGGLLFSGTLIAYVGVVLVPLYVTSKRQ